MPGSPHVANKARDTRNPAKEIKVDIGHQVGKFDTPNVRHRVRQWQVQGGGVVTGDDNIVVVEYENEDPEKKDEKSAPKKIIRKETQSPCTDGEGIARRQSPTKPPRSPLNTPPPSKTPKEMDGDRQAWVRRKSKPNKELEEELRQVGAPKKRVISDGHWRKDRTMPKKVEPTVPKPYNVNRTAVYTENDPKPRREKDDDGIRVTPIKHVSQHRSKGTGDSARPTSKGALDKYNSGPDRDSDHSARRSPDGAVSRTKRRSSRRNISPSSADDTYVPSLAPEDSISKQNGKSPKLQRSPRDHDREQKLARRSPRPKPAVDVTIKEPPKTHGNRIEAWLTQTPGSVGDDVFGSPPSRPRSSKSMESSKSRRSGNRSHVQDDASSVASTVPPTEVSPQPSSKTSSGGNNLRRHFPSTGHRLSTIASVETLETRKQSPAPSELSEQATIVPEDGERGSTGSPLRRRLTKHEDLMSVLSMPRAESKRVTSTRGSRTGSRARRDKLTAKDIWDELANDEAKYQRELRTVVDGVIPVLLSCVLSKSDSAVAAGLFGRSTPSETTVTKPIVDMGIALERLKAHHKRIPENNEITLFTWAQGASRIYTDYLKAWRLGFQDVVVNLAPSNENSGNSWDDDLLKNEHGDLVNADGERVDVAFLLKRPLVRLKHLAKTFKGFNQVLPSVSASAIADKYQQLVIDARRRANEERARLEDEAAASIDPKRARDPRSLAPLAGVSIDTTRCVHARDYFDMELRHSSGQQLDCKIEMILRDDSPGRGNSGDVLICEVSDTGRWLLFPPMRLDLMSARNGTHAGQIVVMLRGKQSDGQEWHELLSLSANEAQAAPEWLQMLGLEPVPPGISRGPSFLASSPRPGGSQSIPGSPKEIQVPIGEMASSASKTWEDNASHVSSELVNEASHSRSGTVHRKPLPSRSGEEKSYHMPNSPLRELFTSIDNALSDNSSLSRKSSRSVVSGLRRTKARKYRSSPVSPTLSQSWESSRSKSPDHPEPLNTVRPMPSRAQSELTFVSTSSTSTGSKKDYSVWLPSSTVPSDDSEEDEDDAHNDSNTPRKPSMHRRVSSVPSVEPPKLPKLRSPSPSGHSAPAHQDEEVQEPSSAPAKLQKRRKSGQSDPLPELVPESSAPIQKKRFSIPSFTPNFLKRNRRPSSPLKHQYEPSIISDSYSDSIYSGEEDLDDSITSDSSDESDHFDDVKPPGVEPSILEAPGLDAINRFQKPTPPHSEPSLPAHTLSPSQSASQAPYRTVPQPTAGASKTVASIFSWSDRGAWDPLHQQECSIVVTPGLIEAFEMVAPKTFEEMEGASPSTRGVQPIVAFEVTPLVPLRRGTALDISIRSPPTENSLIRSSNNVMLRSRSPEECEHLYSLINQARINNPTYIALQNARGPFNESTWAAAMDRRNSNRTPKQSSWWNLPSRKSSTYRSKASQPKSVVTDSSVGTMNSAFSALRRLSGTNNLFDIAKSKITSQEGRSSNTSESLSSGSSTPVVFDPSLGTPLGITNAKIRLHLRESSTKWRDMGSARLTILLPPRPFPNSVPASPRTTGQEKRIIVQGKTRGETLLDVTLGENSFERVARTGIAVSVWEDNTGPNGEVGHVPASGGVSSSKARTYMIQMKSERDCAYTFQLVGKLRY